MGDSFRYWDDCVEPEDMEAMWMDPDVHKEWISVGETKGKKVHMARDPDGQPYLTETEMKAVAGLIVRRHFKAQIDLDMLRAVAEIESDRQPLAMRYDKKTKETKIGLMQMLPTTAEWLVSQMGYRTYPIEGNPVLLYRPFISVYLGAAYLKWLSGFDGKERNEEFVIRAYKGGTKKASHKSTLSYWKRYISVKQSLPSTRYFENPVMLSDASSHTMLVDEPASDALKYWDARVSPEHMEELWKNPNVFQEWTKSGERRGKVRFSIDAEKKPYLSRVEVKAIAEIICSRHFHTRGMRPTVLCALAELSSMRFVNGVGSCCGIMGIDYPTALWLYNDSGYKAYKVHSVDDLSNPFVSMYFGAAYLNWLSEYGGRKRTLQFTVQAYLGGPENVNLQETGPLWTKYQQTVCYYEEPKTEAGHCFIL
ncbi:hypothetical protein AAC387_Pa07g3186 [Persea americana]